MTQPNIRMSYRDVLRGRQRARVFLDGTEIHRVVLVDTEIGVLVRHKIGPNGAAAFDQEKGQIVMEVLQGQIEVQLTQLGDAA
jgi:hypothetical protein